MKSGKQVLNPEPKIVKESRIREEDIQKQQELTMEEDDLNSKRAKGKPKDQNAGPEKLG